LARRERELALILEAAIYVGAWADADDYDNQSIIVKAVDDAIAPDS
jgi:hypothetical protein